jgi:hypothetical protein
MPPRRKKQPAPKPRRKPAAHLLFIECQTSLLKKQSLAIAGGWHARLSSLYPEKKIILAATDGRADLANRLGEFVQGGTRYRAVVIVAHSNHAGIKLTSEDFCDWSQLATWLEPLAPEHLLLVACDAGRLTGVCTLFQSLPSLRTIYASPVPVAPQHAEFLDFLLLQLIGQRRIDESVLRLTQFAAYLATKAVIFQWRRSDCQAHKSFEGHLLSIAAQFFK